MLPENRASVFALPGRFQTPDDQRSALLIDQEYGGVALNDASQGLRVQQWTLSYNSVDVIVTPDSGVASVLFSTSGITELALAFDQNMRAAVAYRKDGGLFLWWWDTVESGYVTTDFGAGLSPRLSLDDKRPSQSNNSDIIFAYIRDGSLYFRQQRDRFLIERLLRSGLDASTRIKTIGMNKQWRLQFELI